MSSCLTVLAAVKNPQLAAIPPPISLAFPLNVCCRKYTPAFNIMADVVSIFMMTKWFHYHVLCSANRGLTDEWNDTAQLLLEAARNAQSPELMQVLAQNLLFQYSVFLPTRICLPDEGIYVVCVCVCVWVCVCGVCLCEGVCVVYVWVGVFVCVVCVCVFV